MPVRALRRHRLVGARSMSLLTFNSIPGPLVAVFTAPESNPPAVIFVVAMDIRLLTPLCSQPRMMS
jgi:hypothetical protein